MFSSPEKKGPEGDTSLDSIEEVVFSSTKKGYSAPPAHRVGVFGPDILDDLDVFELSEGLEPFMADKAISTANTASSIAL
jgi:hypothetical protein